MREGEDGRMLSGNGGYLNRFFTWWFGELRACMPNAISGVLFGAAEWLDVTLEEGEARFTLRRNGSVRDLGHVDLDPAAEESPQNAARDLLLRDHASIGHIALRLPADRVLMPKVELPIAAAENLREALAFEMDRHTPFSAEDVLFDFRVIGSDAELERLQIELLVVRKHDIDEALALAASMGLSPDCVAGPPADGPEAETFNLLSEAERPRPSLQLAWNTTASRRLSRFTRPMSQNYARQPAKPGGWKRRQSACWRSRVTSSRRNSVRYRWWRFSTS
jgi:general secretion pathway protein L